MTCISPKKLYADGFLDYNRDIIFFLLFKKANKSKDCQQERSTK